MVVMLICLSVAAGVVGIALLPCGDSPGYPIPATLALMFTVLMIYTLARGDYND